MTQRGPIAIAFDVAVDAPSPHQTEHGGQAGSATQDGGTDARTITVVSDVPVIVRRAAPERVVFDLGAAAVPQIPAPCIACGTRTTWATPERGAWLAVCMGCAEYAQASEIEAALAAATPEEGAPRPAARRRA